MVPNEGIADDILEFMAKYTTKRPAPCPGRWLFCACSIAAMNNLSILYLLAFPPETTGDSFLFLNLRNCPEINLHIWLA